MPSIKPSVSADAPSVVTRKTGSNAWIISEEISMNMLTKPSIQTPDGIARDRARAGGDSATMGRDAGKTGWE